MKKQMMFSLRAVALGSLALLLAQCSNDELVSMKSTPVGNTTFKAVFEGQPSTKTSISDDGHWNVLWSDQDAFGVFDDANNLTDFSISSGVGSTNATFTGDITQGQTAKWAYYPYASENLSMSDDVITVTIPVNAAYGTPMIAQVADGNTGELSFKHLAAMVKLPVNSVPTEATKLVIT